MLKRFPERSSKLAIGCRSGVRSKAAAEWLLEMGYHSLLEIEGGWLLWSKNPKLPTNSNTV